VDLERSRAADSDEKQQRWRLHQQNDGIKMYQVLSSFVTLTSEDPDLPWRGRRLAFTSFLRFFSPELFGRLEHWSQIEPHAIDRSVDVLQQQFTFMGHGINFFLS
jgi:hypothetical protein